MSTADAEAARSEAASHAARARWREQGDPVLTRSVAIVVSRSADLDDMQRAAIGAAITEGTSDE